MPTAVLNYARKRRWRPTRRQLFLAAAIFIILYSAGYAALRYRRDFIRTQRFETTGPWSHITTYHDIRLGEWRYGWFYEILYICYWPARITETTFWRLYNPKY
jgi:hypothetical protein